MQLYEGTNNPIETKKVESKIHFATLIILLTTILVSSFFIYVNRERVITLENEVKILIKDNIELNKKIDVIESLARSKQEDNTPNDTPLMAYNPVEYSGTLKKEEIPEEYALGDYWYFLYFEEPQVVETVAGDEELEKINVDMTSIDTEEYNDQKVLIQGRLSTGFAETPVILADEITVL